MSVSQQGFDPNIFLGRVVKNYRIKSLIGSGNNGAVYEAVLGNGSSRYAIKVSRIDHLYQSAYERERDVLVNVSTHPQCSCYVLCMFEEFRASYRNGMYGFVVMELMDGNIGKLKFRVIDDVLDFMQQMLGALRFIHKSGYSHGMIKPANVLYRNTPSGRRIYKMTDVGISAMSGPEHNPTLPFLYMDPRVRAHMISQPDVEMSLDLLKSADVFSLGRLFLMAISSLVHNSTIDNEERRWKMAIDKEERRREMMERLRRGINTISDAKLSEQLVHFVEQMTTSVFSERIGCHLAKETVDWIIRTYNNRRRIFGKTELRID